MSDAVLVVDDLRTFPDRSAVYARTSGEAVAALNVIEAVGGTLAGLWLDHDLGLAADGSVDDIKPVVAWLEERAVHGRSVPIADVVIVTSNPVGAGMIDQALPRHYRVRRIDATTAGAVVAE